LRMNMRLSDSLLLAISRPVTNGMERKSSAL
jgi:hypothetical protein